MKYKRVSITLNKDVYDALEKKRKKYLDIDRSNFIEYLLCKKLRIKVKNKPKRKKCFFCCRK